MSNFTNGTGLNKKKYTRKPKSNILFKTSMDIEISELGINRDNIVTIVNGTKNYYDELNYVNIEGVPSVFLEDTIYGTCLFSYREKGVLTGWYMSGNYDDDYSEYRPPFENPTE